MALRLKTVKNISLFSAISRPVFTVITSHDELNVVHAKQQHYIIFILGGLVGLVCKNR